MNPSVEEFCAVSVKSSCWSSIILELAMKGFLRRTLRTSGKYDSTKKRLSFNTSFALPKADVHSRMNFDTSIGSSVLHSRCNTLIIDSVSIETATAA